MKIGIAKRDIKVGESVTIFITPDGKITSECIDFSQPDFHAPDYRVGYRWSSYGYALSNRKDGSIRVVPCGLNGPQT